MGGDGGHGALICALKNPGMYCSVSAFAPICSPMRCAWGKKAFTGYLGPDTKGWQEYDATCLLQKYNGPPLELLVDQVQLLWGWDGGGGGVGEGGGVLEVGKGRDLYSSVVMMAWHSTYVRTCLLQKP